MVVGGGVCYDIANCTRVISNKALCILKIAKWQPADIHKYWME